MCAQKTVLDCTDLVFHLSNFMLDSSAKEFFNSQRLYRGMIERFPGRYKKKKGECLKKIEELLEKMGGRILHISSHKTTIFFQMRMVNLERTLEWHDNCVASYKNGKVTIKTDACMLAWFKAERKYKRDTELIGAFKNFFEC